MILPNGPTTAGQGLRVGMVVRSTGVVDHPHLGTGDRGTRRALGEKGKVSSAVWFVALNTQGGYSMEDIFCGVKFSWFRKIIGEFIMVHTYLYTFIVFCVITLCYF